MRGFNKGNSEKKPKGKRVKLNGKAALQCDPIEWEAFQQKKEQDQEKKERKKFEWDRPLVDEFWTIDDDLHAPSAEDKAEYVGETMKPVASKQLEPEEARKFEQNIINSTIMEDEFLLMESARREHAAKSCEKAQESIYDKFAKEDQEVEKELAGKLDSVNRTAASKTDVRAIGSSVDHKIIIQSEELKHKRKALNSETSKKKIRRRIPKKAGSELSEKQAGFMSRKKSDNIFGQEKNQPSKFREKSANWKNNDEMKMTDGESMGFAETIKSFFGHFSSFSPLQWATAVMAVIIFFTGITTTAVYANYQSEQNKAVALASLSKFEEEDTETVETTIVDEDTALAAAETEETEEKELSLVLSSVEKDLKIKLVDEDDTLVKGVLWGVTVTDADENVSENEDDDEDGIIHLTDISAGEYSVQLNENDELSGYILPTGAQTVSVKAKIEYTVIQDIKEEIKTEKEVDATVEDANGNQEVDVETGAALTDTVEWVESTKTANGDSYVEASVVLANTAKATQRTGTFVAALNALRCAVSRGIAAD
ncbi:MAG TPA: hypothetical protein PLU43_01505, partial [Lachnospiraceae bacterium]|nr:hypothetical protein [Lachnospiraceae bacterium]